MSFCMHGGVSSKLGHLFIMDIHPGTYDPFLHVKDMCTFHCGSEKTACNVHNKWSEIACVCTTMACAQESSLRIYLQ